MFRLRLTTIAIVLLFCATWFRAQSVPSPDLPAGPMKEKATTACAECHDTRIIVQQRLSKAAWTKEVDKMIKWGAVVEPTDRDSVIDYFSDNFGVEKPPYSPEKSAPTGSTRK